MKAAFYHFLAALTRRAGRWVFRFLAGGIAAGYFFFFPVRVAVGVRFYRALFPASGRFLYPLWCTWNQYQHFTHVFLDRLLLEEEGAITCTHEGWEYLEDAVNRGIGGILVMSHLGNWEVASRLLQDRSRQYPGMKLLLYLGEKHREEIERTQKEDLIQSGVKIVTVEEGGGSPADIVEGITFLKAGGLVSMTGDRLWRKDQRSVAVNFLGHEAHLPELPFVFSLLSGAPLFIFFSCRTGKQTYHFRILPPVYVCSEDRGGRAEAIKQTAQFYADSLARTVRRHPFEWFHFEPFLRNRQKNEGRDFPSRK
jgi:predicted LPLAT superfamily acyltransferase